MQNRLFTQYSSKGISVFPVKRGEKIPAGPWAKFQKEKATQSEIDEWEQGNWNVGVVTGSLSNLCVIDADSAEAIEYIESLNLPITPTVETSRGRHYYYRYPNFEVRNAVHVDGRKIDVRGEGGYVVGAGSMHPNGETYTWLVSIDDVEIAPFPEAWEHELNKGQGKELQLPSTRPLLTSVYFDTAIEKFLSSRLAECLEELSKAPKGERNNTLFRVSAGLASDVAGAGEQWDRYGGALTRVAISIALTPEETRATLASAWTSGCKSPTLWLSTAKQWIYVGVGDYFVHLQSGLPLKPKAFDTTFNSQLWSDKGSISAVLTKNNFVEKVHDTTFLPGSDALIVERNGLQWLNTYKPSDIVAEEGDWTRFDEFIRYLVPDDSEREHLLKMIAWTVRRPGEKLGHALLFRSKFQGVGKSTLIEIWRRLLGEGNTRKSTTEEINGPFQGYVQNCLLVVVEELNLGFGLAGYNRVKDLITGDTVSVNEKFLPVRECPNHASFVFLTNLATPVLIEDDDRRMFYIDTPAQRRDAAYYRDFHDWWRSHLPLIRGFLDQVDLAEFDPHARPPETTAKATLRKSSRSPIEQEIALAIEERVGPFMRDVVTIADVRAFLGTGPHLTVAAVTAALKAIGCERPLEGQLRVSGTWSHGHFFPKNGRISPWVVANHEHWRKVDTSALSEEYGREIGIFAAKEIDELCSGVA